MSDDTVDDDSTASDPELTAWDRRMITAIGVVGAARKGATVARVVAIVVALGAVVGAAIFSFWSESFVASNDFGEVAAGWKFEFTLQGFGQFLFMTAAPLAFAGIVFVLSYAIDVAAARLDVDIVLADEDEADD